MSTEQFYARVLLAYPAWWRRERGAEILGVLMAAGDRPSVGETWSLVRHGLALRLLARTPGVWRRPAAVATVLLACVVGVMGSQIVLGALAAVWHQHHPDPNSSWYVDPRWPVGAAWVAAAALVLLRQGWAALVAAWASVALAAIMLAGTSGASLSRAYDLTEGYTSVVFLGPSVVLALLLTRPGRAREGVDRVGYRTLALLFGVVALVRVLGGSEQGLPLAAVLVSLLVLYRRQVLLRGGVALLSGFAWMGLIPLADGSGSRLPHDPVGLIVALGLIPLGVLAVVLVAVRDLELDGMVRRGLVALTGSLARAARRTGPAAE